MHNFKKVKKIKPCLLFGLCLLMGETSPIWNEWGEAARERTLFVDQFFGKDVFSGENWGWDEVGGKTRVWQLQQDDHWSLTSGFFNGQYFWMCEWEQALPEYWLCEIYPHDIALFLKWGQTENKGLAPERGWPVDFVNRPVCTFGCVN